jgi:hypothetical protein
LLLPLLLLPLLFLLHTCAPQIGLLRINLPGLPNPGISARTGGTDRGSRPGRFPELDISANGRVGGAVMGTEEQPLANGIPDGKAGAEDFGAPNGQTSEQGLQPDREQPPDLGIPPPEPKENPEVPAEQTPSLSEPPSSQYSPAPDIPPPELSIPPQALKNGSVDFLNGRWKAGAGIQDAQTGKPLRLDYEFQNGKGRVRVQRGDGVKCSGPVSAEMRSGGMAITSQEQARCSDGGSYKLPEVLCKPGSQLAADCHGSYQNQQFPMSMRQDIQ